MGATMKNANRSLRSKMDIMQYERKTNHNGHGENGRRMDELGKCGDVFGKGFLARNHEVTEEEEVKQSKVA
ncbi:hypothetical protein PIB30_104811 [Stylosanthes scabra]|uniref:Uncharacterized protein n=1 Tax=Stylosanthes scabra TaxID=79078 RepID=A0ABU6V0X4_9FABA|nr:hypothetical protein [Stylosanthes scabra]